MLFHKDIILEKEKIFDYLRNLGISVNKISDKEIILLAFVHKSFASDYREAYPHNERLEFLGDGILWAIMNKILFLDHPDLPESELTLYKIAFVREEKLADVARNIGLWKYIFISNGEEKMKGRDKDSILSDTLEALIWAIYLSLGREEVEKFLKRYLYSELQKIKIDPVKSYKTLVQEYIQKKYKIIPEYRDIENIVETTWNVIEYKSEIHILDEKKSEWFGPSKKKAQESSAKTFYQQFIAWNSTENS